MSYSKEKAILLDLGGVVFESTGQSNAKINWTIIGQLNQKYGTKLNLDAVPFIDFLSEYNILTRQNLKKSEFFDSIFNTLTFNQELIDLLRDRFNIIIVSDNYRENIEYLTKRYRFKNWSERQVYSFDYGVEKSDPDFFKRLLNDISYSQDQLILIDDDCRNLESAAQKGIEGIVYQTIEQVKMDLKSYLD